MGQTDPNIFPKGKIDKVSINTNYVDTNGNSAQMQNSSKFLPANASKLIVSGDGNKFFYLNSGDSNKLYLYDKTTKDNKKLLDYTDIKEIKTGFYGGVVFFARNNYTLWFYDTRNNTCIQMAGVNDPYKFTIFSDDWQVAYFTNAYVNNGSYDYLNLHDMRGGVWNWLQVSGVTALTASYPHILYCYNNVSNGTIKKQSWSSVGFKSTELISSPKLLNASQMAVNKDVTVLYIRVGEILYSLDVNNKVLRQLNAERVGNIVKVTDDNKVYYTDAYNDFMVYDPTSDTAARVRPDNAGNPAFTVDNSGNNMYYDGPGGIYVSDLKKTNRPDRYLLSFDGKQSWLTYKGGLWKKVTNSTTPSVTDVQNNGMTVDEVNALTSEDFAPLYEDGKEVYSVDVAMLFQSPSPSVSPQLNGITVTLNGEGTKGISLLYPVQQVDFDSKDWHSIKKIYPIELQPKEADVIYFVYTGGSDLLKSYKNGQWNTYQRTILSQPADNWETIMQSGMKAEEIRSLNADQLKNLLPATKLSVICITRVDDLSTEGYTNLINIDHVDNLFSASVLTIKIKYTDGTTEEYPNLSKDKVEEFMQWMTERQYNRGPVFYTMKTIANGVEVNDFINYYTIKSVSVNDTLP